METASTPVVAAATGKNKISVQETIDGRRGAPTINHAYSSKCCCYRDKTIVFCRACGFYCHGRIRLKCVKHPRVTFLLDVAECPRCNSPCFMDEYS